MAIGALSNTMALSKTELIQLREKCCSVAAKGLCDEPATYTISRADFLFCVTEVGIPDNIDGEVLDRLFTMFDKTGSDRINTILFLVGICPLALAGNVTEILCLAFEVFDCDNSGEISAKDMISVLSSMNATASYFGDAVISSQEIECIVLDIFNSDPVKKKKIKYADVIKRISIHENILQFVNGAGTVRYGIEKI